jgi:hypothetical protein
MSQCSSSVTNPLPRPERPGSSAWQQLHKPRGVQNRAHSNPSGIRPAPRRAYDYGQFDGTAGEFGHLVFPNFPANGSEPPAHACRRLRKLTGAGLTGRREGCSTSLEVEHRMRLDSGRFCGHLAGFDALGAVRRRENRIASESLCRRLWFRRLTSASCCAMARLVSAMPSP